MGGEYVWRWRKHLGERYGEQCSVVCRGRGAGPRNVLVRFRDGFQVVAPRWAVKLVKR